jgi:hypothetical protein
MIARAFCLLSALALLPLSMAQATDLTPDIGASERRASILPEPGNLALLAAGVAGLLIGRRGGRSRRRDD